MQGDKNALVATDAVARPAVVVAPEGFPPVDADFGRRACQENEDVPPVVVTAADGTKVVHMYVPRNDGLDVKGDVHAAVTIHTTNSPLLTLHGCTFHRDFKAAPTTTDIRIVNCKFGAQSRIVCAKGASVQFVGCAEPRPVIVYY